MVACPESEDPWWAMTVNAARQQVTEWSDLTVELVAAGKERIRDVLIETLAAHVPPAVCELQARKDSRGE